AVLLARRAVPETQSSPDRASPGTNGARAHQTVGAAESQLISDRSRGPAAGWGCIRRCGYSAVAALPQTWLARWLADSRYLRPKSRHPMWAIAARDALLLRGQTVPALIAQ